ncbi:MAG: hypothetical protein ACP5M4_13685 [Acidobacteriaceae bacterium]
MAAIDQFKIDLGFFMPDLGPNSGVINVITKSGTNHLHGEAYDYWRSDKLDATNYFATVPGTLRRDQFGIALGGPIIIPRLLNGHNKLWFFFNYEGTRQAQDNQERGYTPTSTMMSGNFSAESSDFTIYNPYTYDPSTGTRQPFPNNIIPPSMISPVAEKLLAYYLPGSNYNQKPANLFRSVPSTLNDNQFTIRVDATPSSRQSLFATVIHDNYPAVDGALMPSAGHSFPLEADLGSLQDTLTLGANMVNIARIGFERNSAGDDGQGESGPALETQIGIPGTVDPHGIPSVNIQGFTGFGNPTGKIGNTDDIYQLYDSLDISKGNHNFALGAGLLYTRSVQSNANANSVGGLNFAPIFTAQLAPSSAGLAPVAGTGNAFADFLLGMPSNGHVVGFQPMHYRYTEFYPYFQDSWRVTPAFTVNYGISWYYETVPNPQGPDRKIPHDFNFSTGLLQYAGLGQVSPQIIKPNYKSFTPRLGFAWHPRWLGQTVVHAGAGLYYGQKGLLETQFTYIAPPFQAAQSFSNDQFSPMPTYTFGNSNPENNVFPVLKLPPLTNSFASSLPQGFSPFAVNPNSKQPYTWQWVASIQHTIDRNDLVEVDYIGNSSHDQQNRYNADQCLVSATNYCEPNTKPYPRYGFILYSNTNGNSSYEAMIVKYQHQTSWGLNLLANFQYSKTLSDSWGTADSTANQNAYCRSCDKGPVSYDIPHALTVSAVYDLPIGRGRSLFSNMPRPANAFVGGWRISAITTLQAGNPFTVTSPNNTSSPFSVVRADQTCNGADSYLSHHLRSDGFVYFRTSCFSSPPAGYFGNSPRGVLFGPGAANTDVGLAKDIAIYRALKLELRGQFFNVFNHPNFGNPDAYTGSSSFGVINTAGAPRILQIAGRFVW